MYNKKQWVSKEIITKEALNNIENGIYEISEALENLDPGISEERVQDIINEKGFLTEQKLNEKGFITEQELNEKGFLTEQKLNEKGFITEHQDISGKQDKTDDN